MPVDGRGEPYPLPRPTWAPSTTFTVPEQRTSASLSVEDYKRFLAIRMAVSHSEDLPAGSLQSRIKVIYQAFGIEVPDGW